MSDPFIRTRLLIGDEPLDRLAAARVAVFGVGGVGGFCVEALARAGFVRCSCDTGLSGRIFVRRDATYNPVPMFALRAYRP